MTPVDPGLGATPTDPRVFVFVVERDGTIVRASIGRAALPPEAILEGSVLDYLGTDDRPAVRAALERVFYTGSPERFECRFPPLGESAWFRCRMAADRRGAEVVSATILACEVTSWKAIERTVELELERLDERLASELERLTGQPAAATPRRTADRFYGLVDEAGEAIFVTEAATGRIVDVNDTACRWLMRERQELVSLRIEELELEFPVHAPLGRAHLTETRRTTRPWISDHGVHRRQDGSVFPVEVTILPRQIADREYLLIVVRDVKGRREARAQLQDVVGRYRSLFELSSDPVLLLGRDGTVADANRAASLLLGYTRAELRGLDVRTLYTRPDEVQRLREAMADADVVRDLPVDLRAKSGESLRVRLTATVQRDTAGEVRGYQCLLRPDGGGPALPSVERSSENPEPGGGGPSASSGAGPTRRRWRAEIGAVPEPPQASPEHPQSAAPEAREQVATRAAPESGSSRATVYIGVRQEAPEPESPRVEWLNPRPERTRARSPRPPRLDDRRPDSGFWGTAAAIGVVLAALGWVDLTTVWRAAVTAGPGPAVDGADYGRAILGASGPMLAGIGVLGLGWRRLTRALGAIFLAIVVVLGFQILVFLVELLFGSPAGTSGVVALSGADASRAVAFATVLLFAYGWFGRYLWLRSATPAVVLVPPPRRRVVHRRRP